MFISVCRSNFVSTIVKNRLHLGTCSQHRAQGRTNLNGLNGLNVNNPLSASCISKRQYCTHRGEDASSSTPVSKMALSGQPTNRLALEKSPYLLQHKHNPVDWYPWGEEAFARARSEHKLIFLSIGYSTCHWCHVMEKESFESEEIAALMNENFINIKVDREERPDIDKIYMIFVQFITGSGGWPMSVWLTPNLAPVGGGTYFPPKDRWGMPSFKNVIQTMIKFWENEESEAESIGKVMLNEIQKRSFESEKSGNDGGLSVEERFNEIVTILLRNYDTKWGGFRSHPKFPECSRLNMVFHAHAKKSNRSLLDTGLKTLRFMANGGIHDQVFGGFSRYSVDRRWHVPHFEKMLYDQGQLLSAYANGYKLTKDTFYLDVADRIFEYVTTDLQHPEGGFYSGEDADSLPTADDTDKVEGAFYAWSHTELADAFAKSIDKFDCGSVDVFEVYAHHFSVTETGNVEPASDQHGNLTGKNILMTVSSVEDTAQTFDIDPGVVKNIIQTGNRLLYEIRCKRPRPHLDTKIICSWNGLMLSGLADLSCITVAPRRQLYIATMKRLIEFVRKHLYNADTKKLLRSCYGDGVNSTALFFQDQPIDGFLDDYAFLIKGLLDYYKATLDTDILRWALELQEQQHTLFWDKEKGGYFDSEENSPNVVIRLKGNYDGGEPSGNSVAAKNLLMLAAYFEQSHLRTSADKLFEFYSNVSTFGLALPEMMSALLLSDTSFDMLVVVGAKNDDSEALIDIARNYYTPALIIIHLKIDEPDEVTRKSTMQFKMIRNLPTAYLCHNKACQLPVTDPVLLTESFDEKYSYNQ